MNKKIKVITKNEQLIIEEYEGSEFVRSKSVNRNGLTTDKQILLITDFYWETLIKTIRENPDPNVQMDEILSLFEKYSIEYKLGN